LHALEAIAQELIQEWWAPDNPKGLIIDQKKRVATLELGKAFANEFPISVVAEVLGIPQGARQQFTWWYDAMMSGLGGSETHHEGLEARQDLEKYVEDLVEEKRGNPTYLQDELGDEICMDIISELCNSEIDGDVMSTEEITSFIALVVGGGGETTRGAIMNLWYLLLQDKDQYGAVQSNDELWDTAFHEMLRHSTSIGGQPRHNTNEIIMHGVTIPAGSLIHMVDVSANHDERVFSDPEEFNIFRNDLYSGKILRSGHDKEGKCSHMAFGVGPHLCPGAWISHQETVIGSRILESAFTNARINEDLMPKDIDDVSLAPIGLGSIRELWIDFDIHT
jgi:pulcherriminic acid synthase